MRFCHCASDIKTLFLRKTLKFALRKMLVVFVKMFETMKVDLSKKYTSVKYSYCSLKYYRLLQSLLTEIQNGFSQVC